VTAAVLDGAAREFAATVERTAVRAIRGRMQATVADLLGQALAIETAASGKEVSRRAKGRASARAGGIRAAAKQMQQTLRGDNQS
jgi:hypothetical protein